MVQAKQPDLKALGNAEFKAGSFLKAAGLYTRAIKEDPDSAVLYSNRSAALLRLNKVAKALADADAAIARKPDWEKGYIRKAAALEAQNNFSGAAEQYCKAAELAPDNAEVSSKLKALQRQLGQSASAGKVSPAAAAISEHLKQFAQRVIALTKAAVLKDGLQQLRHSVYLCKPDAKGGGGEEEQMTQVSVSTAFDSPEVLQDCLSYLRQTAQEQGFTAACAVAMQSGIAYPQVWKRPDWPLQASQEGIFVQLDSLQGKRLWYLPFKDGLLRDPQALKLDFKLLEPLFR